MEITTKYDMDDKVWIVSNSEIIQTVITKINIQKDAYRFLIEYTTARWSARMTAKEIFKTKQDAAMDILKQNGIDVGLLT